MKSSRILGLLAALSLLVCTELFSQGNPPFDLEAYRAFLLSHQTMTGDQLLALHPTGSFVADARVNWDGTSEGGNTVASGVYFYHLVVGSHRQMGKMGFVK